MYKYDTGPSAPVAQRIERQPPELEARVRVSAGVPNLGDPGVEDNFKTLVELRRDNKNG